MTGLTEESMEYIISRLLDNANEAQQEWENNKTDPFCSGRRLAYYEMLDILKSEFDAHDADLKELGLDIDVNLYA